MYLQFLSQKFIILEYTLKAMLVNTKFLPLAVFFFKYFFLRCIVYSVFLVPHISLFAPFVSFLTTFLSC